GVLRVGVVDIQPGAVGENDVRQPQIVIRERFGGIVGRAAVGESARVPQRRLFLVVPPSPPAPGQLGARPIGVDHLRGRHHRIRSRLAGHRDPVLNFGAHDPPYAHAATSSLASPMASSVARITRPPRSRGWAHARHETVPTGVATKLVEWRQLGRRKTRRRNRLTCSVGARSRYRYWPVLLAVSIERPASAPFPPETRVRM